jgi:hypothetical protein
VKLYSSDYCTKSRVRIPKLLWFDERKHVLVLEDLGEGLISVDEWLCPQSDTAPSVEACRSAGARLGDVLAAIHSDGALHDELGSNQFVNPDVTDLWANEVVGKIKELLVKHLSRRDGDASLLQRVEDEAEIVSGIIQREFEHQDEAGGPRRTMFSHGDLSILMSPSEIPDIGLFDWEFAGERRVLEDLGQLSAWLHLFAQANGWSSSDALG